MSYRRIHFGLVALTWFVFLMSFVLPWTNVMVGHDGKPIPGWRACLYSVAIPLADPVILIALIRSDPASLLVFIVPLANLHMFVSPVFAARRPLSLFFCPALAFGGIVPWLLPGELVGNMFIGFYCWNGSFWTMVALCVSAPWIDMS